MTKRQKETIRELKLENKELKKILINLKNSTKCPFCLSLVSIKSGKRYTNRGVIQRYKCLACSKRFTIMEADFRMRHNIDKINKALKLNKQGLSLRQISNIIKNVSHTTIFFWIKEFSGDKYKIKLDEEETIHFNKEEVAETLIGAGV